MVVVLVFIGNTIYNGFYVKRDNFHSSFVLFLAVRHIVERRENPNILSFAFFLVVRHINERKKIKYHVHGSQCIRFQSNSVLPITLFCDSKTEDQNQLFFSATSQPQFAILSSWFGLVLDGKGVFVRGLREG